MRWKETLGILAVGAALTRGPAQAQTAPFTGVFAITNARIEIGDGRVLEKGTVILRDGLIEAVGVGLTPPADAEIIKGDGLVVYPGFIDGHDTQGLKLPDPQPAQDTPPDTTQDAPPFMREANRKGVTPELRAMDCLAFTDATLNPLRLAGFTTAQVAPEPGTITGVSALVNLSGLPKRDCVVRPEVAMNFTFRTTGRGFFGGGYPGSLLGIIANLRQTLLDANHYHALQTAFASGGGKRPPADDVLAALQPVMNGTMPVIFNADSQNEIYRAAKIADEFGLRLEISGGAEAYKWAGVLAKRQIPIFVGVNFGTEPVVDKPAAPPAPKTPSTGRPGVGKPAAGKPTVPPAGQTPPTAPPAGQTPPNAPPPDKPAPRPDDTQEDARPIPAPADAKTVPPTDANAKPADADASEEDDLPRLARQERHRKWEEKVANAAQLQKAGVLFAFSSRGVKSLPDFLPNVRRAIKAGLPKDAALRALTINPAKILGVDRQIGTIAAGKIAALVVMSGDFADEKSKVRYLFIDRAKIDPDNAPSPRLPGRPRFPVEEE